MSQSPRYNPNNVSLQMPQGMVGVGMNPTVFEQQIRDHGIRMIHSKPLQCPNRKDIYSPTHDADCKMCVDGYIYYGHKEFTGTFMGNSNSRQNLMQGTYDADVATIILPVTYEDGTQLVGQFYDQITIVGKTIDFFQLVEHAKTGRDVLQFEAVSVNKLIDARGNEYSQGIDFIVDQGDIVWTPDGNRPGMDITLDRGVAYTVNYACVPVFTVVSLPHQLRTTTQVLAGKKVESIYPQLVFCRKDFIPSKKSDDVGFSDVAEPLDE